MAAKTPRLKVYKTHIGLDDWVVAAPNQKAALRAWDVREDLFASGAATVVTDKASVEAAMKTPGVPVSLTDRRAIKIAEPPRKPQSKAKRPQPVPAHPKKSPDRSRLDRAEAALADLKREEKVALATLDKQRRALEVEIEDATAAFRRRRREVENELSKARKAYEAAKRF